MNIYSGITCSLILLVDPPVSISGSPLVNRHEPISLVSAVLCLFTASFAVKPFSFVAFPKLLELLAERKDPKTQLFLTDLQEEAKGILGFEISSTLNIASRFGMSSLLVKAVTLGLKYTTAFNN